MLNLRLKCSPLLFSTSFVFLCTAFASGSHNSDKPVSFYKDIRPILRKRCQGCHQPASQGGKLVVTSYATFRAGGASGVGFIPGRPNDSAVFRFIGGSTPSMPKNQKPLPTSDVELFRKWIAEGAKDDTPVIKDPIDSEHPPVYTTPPVVSAMAYSPDGTLLAVSGYHETLIHKADGSGIIARLIGKATRIESLAWSPDGSILAVVGGFPGRFGTVQFWKRSDFSLINEKEWSYDSVYGGSFSPDGKFLAIGGADNVLRVITVPDGVLSMHFDNHSDWIFATAWLQNTATFADKGTKGQVRNVVGQFENEQHLVSTGRDKAIKLIVARTGHFVDDINTFTSAYRTMAALKSADHVLVGGDDGVVRKYQVFRTKARTMNQEDHNLLKSYEALKGRVNAIAVSQDGKQFVAAGEGGEARVFDTETGAVIAKIMDPETVFSVGFQPDGKSVVLGGMDGKIRFYDPRTGAKQREIVPVPIGGKK